MLIVYLLIPLSIILLGLAVWAFFWAVNNGQFDDLDTPAERILHEDDERNPL
ncbi:MAG: cbb3-type cytochrome oxidase assembly protein CcoS [Gammaproteobacteria bacterium]|nr:cbb3-type cytochrome oxidase assembly protein CcoS [Gammaproteobacteria bacterium]